MHVFRGAVPSSLKPVGGSGYDESPVQTSPQAADGAQRLVQKFVASVPEQLLEDGAAAKDEEKYSLLLLFWVG